MPSSTREFPRDVIHSRLACQLVPHLTKSPPRLRVNRIHIRGQWYVAEHPVQPLDFRLPALTARATGGPRLMGSPGVLT